MDQQVSQSDGTGVPVRRTRMASTDFDDNTLRGIFHVKPDDEAMLGPVHAILKQHFPEMADTWLARVKGDAHLRESVQQMYGPASELRTGLCGFLERLIGGPYDPEFAADLKELGMNLLDLSVSVPDVIAAAGDLRTWARLSLVARLGEWKAVEPLLGPTERIMDYAMMLVIQGMSAAMQEMANAGVEDAGSGSFTDPGADAAPRMLELSQRAAGPVVAVGTGAGQAPGSMAGALERSSGFGGPGVSGLPPRELAVRLMERFGGMAILAADYSGRVLVERGCAHADESAGLAQHLVRKGIQLGKLLGVRTFCSAQLGTKDKPVLVLSLPGGLLWIEPGGAEQTRALQAELAGLI